MQAQFTYRTFQTVPLMSMVTHTDCKHAEELLDALSPRSQHFRDPHDPSRRYRQYIFRGHADDRFTLLPSALRLKVMIKSRFGSGTWGTVEPNPHDLNKDTFLEARHRMPVTPNWTNFHQVWAEALMLNDFFNFADASGLVLPEDSRKNRLRLEGLLIELRLSPTGGSLSWPPSEVLSLLALAQHYGVPTRLLDWTRSGYTAAYFAAAGAVQFLSNKKSPFPKPATHLSVWAFNIEVYNIRREVPPPLGNKGSERVKIITVPSAGNPNLNSQKGLFTIYQPKLRLGERVDRISLDQAIKPFGVVPVFIHFRLPISEAGKLLRLLFLEGVSGASVFAGYNGAAKAVLEQLHWDNWDRPGDIWQQFPAIP
jgi:hypothetical protein